MSSLMRVQSVSILVLMSVLALVLVAGCGGGGKASAPVQGTGTVVIRIAWPEVGPADVDTRLIPSRSNSIKIEFVVGGSVIEHGLIARPSNYKSFDRLPAGDMLLRGTAYPNADGTGTPQARAEANITVVLGTTNREYLALASTITTVEVTPNPAEVDVGDNVQLTAASKDAAGATVLVPVTSAYTWAVTDGEAHASVDADGLVTGLAEGTATVRATEKESGVAGDAQVYTGQQDEIVVFPDPNLEAAIREAIHKPSGDIHKSDLIGLTYLRAKRMGIADLSGLEHCTNLVSLYLYGNQISDVGPLSGLTNLTELNLYGNQISDVGPLSGLTNLTELNLCGNQISDLAPLSGLINLTQLLVGSNQISDVGPLCGLTNLAKVRLHSNQISDVGPLSDLTNLQYLSLDDNQITEIGPLVANPGLASGDTLLLRDNPLDLSPGSQASQDIQALRDRGVDVIL